MTNERTNAELIKAIRDEDMRLGEHAMLSARIIHDATVTMQTAYIEATEGKGDSVAVAWIENLLIDSDNVPEEEYGGAGDLKNAHDPDLYFRDNHLSGDLSPYQSRMAPLIDELERRIDGLQKSLDEARNQKPVAFWWLGPDGKDNGGPYRGKPSDAAIDNARNMGCDPQLLFAVPIPAPAVPSGWNIRRDGDVLIVQHPDIGGCSVQKEPDWERMIPEAILYSLADALLQPRAVKDSLTTQADCRACVNRGRINGLSQESYCDSCVYEGRGWRQNHFVDASKMVDTAKRRCEACAILPCSCK